MSFDQSKWIWRDGKIIPWADATIHISAHVLHYGSGVFEGLRCYETVEGSAIFRGDAHFERFLYSAGVYGMSVPYSIDQLIEASCEAIRRNEFKSCYIRPIAFYGSDTLGVNPRNCPVVVAILTWPWAAYLGVEGLDKGVRITQSPWIKFHSKMLPTTAKACGQYLNSMLAVCDATGRGFDEALLLNTEGTIAEGSGENLFVIKNGVINTNDENSSILLGITRDSVIQISQDLGYEVRVGRLALDDLISADEAFFTGTAAEVTPIREVDGRQIGTGVRGPITKRIQDVFFSITKGEESQYKHWLHYIK